MNKRMAMFGRNVSRSVFAGILVGLILAPNCFGGTDAAPCSANSENRQLDYWLGNWKIGAENSGGSAHSTVSLSLDKCLVVENWDGGRGHSGQNIFGYSADDKNWYGMFADNEGRVHVFSSGTVSSGSAEFKGTSRGPNGESVLNRVKVTRLTPNKVEQTWEKSSDNGTTWSLAFRGEYTRANP
ncbi:MAG TPA: hypothetical protein VFF50_06335 [Candidatus Deferrimicrobiaceae bacterium]|nr:hypothetical protein [Candidatus Deferrimicrobiaceae bacterium]